MGIKGIVYLIGAGPGDMGLLTIRAKELIESADVLIYDNLVNNRIIDALPGEKCQKIYVGKSGSHHTLEQDEINRLIAEKARDNAIVVRLKGGDPFIFGRGGEEALHCAHEGIPFEVVNGISSAYAVPSYAGIPVTNRGYSASVAFITGHEDPTKLDTDIHWDHIATGIQTLVFLMGVKNLPFIAKKLIENGRSADTPAAIIENGCQPMQRTVTGTLADIEKKARDAGIRPPSIIVVGDVVSLREKINWYETRPLFGKNIVVTRSREQASQLVSRLSELGANVIELPVIKIAPPENSKAIQKSIEEISLYDWIIFTSVNGVNFFFKFLNEMGRDARSLSGVKICAIGSATADKLRESGLKADLMPEKYVSTEVAAALIHAGEVKDKSFLLPRADIAPKDLAEKLINEGAKRVDDITIYRTVQENPDTSGLENHPVKGHIDMVTFTSSSTVKNFHTIINGTDFVSKESLVCAAIGPVTAETAKKMGYTVAITADVHTIEGLVDSVMKHFRS